MGVEGRITTSLWESMRKQSISPEFILKFADIFSWTVDFLTEPRAGDFYKLVWVRYTSDKGVVIDDKILSAEYFGLETREHTAIRYNNEYYDPDGKSLQKQFLHAPLQFRRITSYFSRRRFHPILRYYRPHLGIDYAAHRGTPVSAIGDGKVIFCGRKREEGKLVVIKHDSIYKSYYGHLARYGKGIRNGKRVKQGQVIGYVGSTGLATGAHLDFRIKKYGKSVNFLKLKFPPANNVRKKDLAEFNRIKKERLAQMASIPEGSSSPCKLEEILSGAICQKE
jgi:murein DD-endopeptidase MepM/ murein hydrolase activator NlpD